MAYDPRSVANYILVVRRHFDFATTQLELQKLLYFCHGAHLVRYDKPLVDGYFEAWEHGPVHPLIFREFNEFKAKPITRRSYSTNLVSGERSLIAPPSDQSVRTLIAETVLQLRHLSASQLRNKSHAPGGPWHSVVESAKINLASHVRIPDDVIRKLYHRHILPLGDLGDVDDAFEDKPPQPDGRDQHGGSPVE